MTKQSLKTTEQPKTRRKVFLGLAGLAAIAAAKPVHDRVRNPAFASVPAPRQPDDLLPDSRGNFPPAMELTLRIASKLDDETARVAYALRAHMIRYVRRGTRDVMERDRNNVDIGIVTRAIEQNWRTVQLDILSKPEFNGYNNVIFQAVRQVGSRQCVDVQRVKPLIPCS